MKKAPPCEVCGKTMVPLLMGLPVLEDWGAVERGEIVLGGCIVNGDEPPWACAACERADD